MKTGVTLLASLMLFVWTAMLGGCATMMSGTTQEVSFQSSPDDVVVTVTQRVRDSSTDYMWKDEVRILGKTPLTLQLDKVEHQTVTFSKQGYKPVTMKMATTLDAWFWGNIAFGGLIGTTTDSMSGAINEYSLSQYFVTLTPDGGSGVEDSTLTGQGDKARAFIVRRYTTIMTDLSKGSGEDLSALLSLLHITSEQEADARRKIRALSEVYLDVAVFANHVAELYLK